MNKKTEKFIGFLEDNNMEALASEIKYAEMFNISTEEAINDTIQYLKIHLNDFNSQQQKMILKF